MKLIKAKLTEYQKYGLISIFHECYYNTDQDTKDFAVEFFAVVESINNDYVPIELKFLVDFESYIINDFPELAYLFSSTN